MPLLSLLKKICKSSVIRNCLWHNKELLPHQRVGQPAADLDPSADEDFIQAESQTQRVLRARSPLRTISPLSPGLALFLYIFTCLGKHNAINRPYGVALCLDFALSLYLNGFVFDLWELKTRQSQPLSGYHFCLRATLEV